MELEFTTEYATDSSLVETVYHNENDNTVVIDLNDELYKYSDVNPVDVSSLVSADSVGAYYNTEFKNKYGPAEHIGTWYDVDDFVVVPRVKAETAGTPKGLVGTTTAHVVNAQGQRTNLNGDVLETKEFSLQSPVAPTQFDFDDMDDSETIEYSLVTPPAADTPSLATDEADGVTSVVYFTLDDYDKLYSLDGNHTSVEGAIAEVNDYVKRLGGKGRVQQVVFDFAN